MQKYSEGNSSSGLLCMWFDHVGLAVSASSVTPSFACYKDFGPEVNNLDNSTLKSWILSITSQQAQRVATSYDGCG